MEQKWYTENDLRIGDISNSRLSGFAIRITIGGGGFYTSNEE